MKHAQWVKIIIHVLAIVTKLTKVTPESSCRVLKVISKWKTLNQSVYFLKAVEACLTFDIEIHITLGTFCEISQKHNC